jgi:hypothetical protein
VATRTTSLIHETGSVRTGTWRATTSSFYLGGKAYYASTRNATASYTFTGRSVGLIVKRATNVGAFYAYVDGVKTAFVDTKAASTAYRQTIWTKSWSTSAKHTVKSSWRQPPDVPPSSPTASPTSSRRQPTRPRAGGPAPAPGIRSGATSPPRWGRSANLGGDVRRLRERRTREAEHATTCAGPQRNEMTRRTV